MQRKRLYAAALAVWLVILCVPVQAAEIPTYNTTEELAYHLVLSEQAGSRSLTYNGVDPAVKLGDNSVLIQIANMVLPINLKQISYIQSRGTYTLKWNTVETDKMRSDAAAVAESAVKSVIRPEMSVREKYRALHDWLAGHCSYAQNAAYDGQLAWNALVDRRSVCNGYAKAFMLLCETAGLPCLVVMGEADNGNNGYVPHAWNMVAADSQWLFIDVTWDDPISKSADNLRDTYFLLTYEQMAVDHKAEALDKGKTPDKSILQIATLFCPDRVDAADILFDMGLIAGTGTGYALTSITKRSEAAALFSRLLGIDKTYDAATYPMPFSDVDTWAVPFVAVLYKNGYTAGIGGGLFGSNNPITLAMYASQLLWALDYDIEYAQATEKAVEYGLLTSEEVTAIQTRGFLRGDMFMLSHRSLGKRVHSSTQTLGEKLGYASV